MQIDATVLEIQLFETERELIASIEGMLCAYPLKLFRYLKRFSLTTTKQRENTIFV